MAKYRPFFSKFWKDPDIQELTPIEKLIFAYLFTCESTTTSGIYAVTARTISHETGVGVEEVKGFLSNGKLRNVIYDHENYFIFVKGFKKYNKGGAPEVVAKSIVSDYEKSRCTSLWDLFIQAYPEYKDDLLKVGEPKKYVK
jgi:hypothetical protein